MYTYCGSRAGHARGAGTFGLTVTSGEFKIGDRPVTQADVDAAQAAYDTRPDVVAAHAAFEKRMRELAQGPTTPPRAGIPPLLIAGALGLVAGWWYVTQTAQPRR
jgi:hypothetical protein